MIGQFTNDSLGNSIEEQGSTEKIGNDLNQSIVDTKQCSVSTRRIYYTDIENWTIEFDYPHCS